MLSLYAFKECKFKNVDLIFFLFDLYIVIINYTKGLFKVWVRFPNIFQTLHIIILYITLYIYKVKYIFLVVNVVLSELHICNVQNILFF